MSLKGGIGVGIVTKAGLEQPVGEAAINRVPRQMIKQELDQIKEDYDYDGGFCVTISIPKGVELAQKTFNPKLGIEGGISVLGTSGIVEPMSEQALIESI
ncbi:MAG: cobalt-precorrin-5B (C(1))-methyltransferase, partial [Acutalibacteraceae bacterium]